MENFSVMITLFIIVILGYMLAKLRYMSVDFCRQLSAIVVDVTCPLLILSSVMGDTMPDRRLILPLLGVGVLTYVILTVVAYLVPRALTQKASDHGIIGFALMFANVGFIGYPIVASIFGHAAVFYAALLNMANTFFIFTVGVDLIKGHDSSGQKHRFDFKVLFSPGLLAAYAAVVIVALKLHVSPLIARPVTMVGNITVPASLMVIGATMASLPLRDMLGNRLVYAVTALRLGAVPIVLYFLFRLMGVNALVNDINTVVIAMPVASFGTMFCMKYGRDVTLMTELTFLSTVASIFTIPLITLIFH
ncbi:AEC family transporter [Prevotella lacticifex]|uniref:Permease n=1 Tax=Prevotella lacticifex TaxID=2854755 RepID=A0A9R1CYJ5_9BACT|nr:AEC family transporter [Prevotella lacticifex]GJG36436.1 permease [Prevotella lacticifex]GJG38295.1 permease [Prevotella lacticifex]GJG43022.1 permease [Prevotella lacticifex]GJG44652.1 permease [Prevotella lacticifex]GJG49373.1 permease [Prevotella lacticifex]